MSAHSLDTSTTSSDVQRQYHPRHSTVVSLYGECQSAVHTQMQLALTSGKNFFTTLEFALLQSVNKLIDGSNLNQHDD